MKSKLYTLGVAILVLGGVYFLMFTKDTSYCEVWGTKTELNQADCRFIGGNWVSETTYSQGGVLIMMLGVMVGLSGTLISEPQNAEADNVNICPNCDSLLPENSQFCNSCGHKILINEST